jgi:hypothetical protein
VGREEATVRLELWQGVAAIQPPTQMRGRGKGRGACGVLRRENGDGRGKKGRRRRATPLFKPRVGGVGERGGRGESVVRHDMWRRGWGGVRPVGGVSDVSGSAVTHAGGAVLSEQGSAGGL